MPGTMVIRNGYVLDPLNEIDGEIKDIFIKDGKIVDEHGFLPVKIRVIRVIFVLMQLH